MGIERSVCHIKKKPLVAKAYSAWYSDGILAYKVSLSSFHFHIHQHIVNVYGGG